MHIHRLTHAVDVHAAGWPLRVVLLPGACRGDGSLAEWADRLWQDGGEAGPSPIRWLQQEPRGHAAMRIGAIVPAARPAPDLLLVFNAQGPCRADGLDALCAAAAMGELGVVYGGELQRRQAINGRTIQSDNGLFRVRMVGEEAVVSGERPATIRERGRRIRTGSGTFAADIVRSGGETYAVLDARDNGLRLRIEAVAELEAAAGEIGRAAGPGLRIVLLERGSGTLRAAVFGPDGKLLRAPESRALGAALCLLSEGDTGLAAKGLTVEGLTGAAVFCRAAALSPGAKGGSAWETRCRPFVTGALQFMMDPGDELGEGFLLR